MTAVFLVLKAFCKNYRDKHVRVKSDNTYTVLCLNAMGGVKSQRRVGCLFKYGPGALRGIFG